VRFTPISILFNNKKQGIPAVLEICVQYINEKSKAFPVELSLVHKMKWVISEMLSNSLKHSGTDECILTISASADYILIEKKDSGKPLILTEQSSGTKIEWPLSAISNIDCEIYHNGMDSLRVLSEDTCKATFYTENLNDASMPDLLFNISEHFGLLIITKSCDRFIYEYDPETNTNLFKSYFTLKHNLV